MSTEDVGRAEAAPSPGPDAAVPVAPDQRGVPPGQRQLAAPVELPAAPVAQPAAMERTAAPVEQPAAAAEQLSSPDRPAGAEQEQRRQWRRALFGMVIPLLVVFGFALSYISAFHEPSPHGVKVAVVGPAAQTAPFRAALARRVGQAFDVRAAPTQAVAARQVYDKDLNGAYIPSARPHGTATAIVNSASGGPSVASAVESLAHGVAAQQGARLAVRDVRPLPPGDRGGTALFYYLASCTIGAMFTVAITGILAPTLRPQRRYLLILAAAIALPVLVYLVGGPLIGAYTGRAGTVFALIEVGALYTFIVAVTIRGFQVLLGPLAIIAGLAIFVILDFPSSGGAVAGVLLPAFWRFLNGFWIGASAEDAFRSILYLGGHGVATDLEKLVGWLILPVALFAFAVWRKRMQAQPGHRKLSASASPEAGTRPA